MNKEQKKIIKKEIKKNGSLSCSLDPTIEECYELYDKYGFTFTKKESEVCHLMSDNLIELGLPGFYLQPFTTIAKEIF